MRIDVFPPTSEQLIPRLGQEHEIIGDSRDGRPIPAVRLGNGPLKVSITAGAHADEPAGPLAALSLIRFLSETDEGHALLERTQWWICPQVNPDGAQRNAAWFRETPELELYTQHFQRELPGDDVEFNYPTTPAQHAQSRPENRAVAEFLRAAGTFNFHASLHSMAFAEGAWWLIGRYWIDRTAALRERLVRLFEERNFGLHDIDRHGEKGFTRIARGFCTTPRSDAMAAFFHGQNDKETAAKFLPSSMEFVQSMGGDPLVMVSELPMFILRAGATMDPPGGETPYTRFREQYREARNRLLDGDRTPLHELVEEYRVEPVPFERHAATIRDGIILSVQNMM